MTTIAELLALVMVVLGTIFSMIGVLGFHRMPDVYTRLHTTGKVGVLGILLLLVAAALVTPLAWSKALVLILFLLFASPVTAHALSSAAHRLGIKMVKPYRNDFQEVSD